MKPRLSELYADAKEIYHLSLIAGENGLSGQVSWVHMLEDIDTIEFTRGSELIITTGVIARGDNAWLCALAKRLIEKNCSGLILNIGNYIRDDQITQELSDLCDAGNFPLFTMPLHVHIVDLMRDYCHKIFVNTYLDKTLSKLFRTLLFNPSEQESMLPLLAAGGYDTGAPCCVALFRHMSALLNVNGLLNRFDVNFHSFLKGDLRVVVLSGVTYELLAAFLEQFNGHLESAMAFNPAISRPVIGVSEIAPEMSRLHFRYTEALHALNFAEYCNKPLRYFKDMGIFRILLSVENTDMLRRFWQDSLRPLLEYDRRNNSELADTLRAYLLNDCNIRRTAEAVFVHRNTVRYRIGRIRSLLCGALDTEEERFHLRLVFYVRELFEFLNAKGF
jgi:hypothetical protein